MKFGFIYCLFLFFVTISFVSSINEQPDDMIDDDLTLNQAPRDSVQSEGGHGISHLSQDEIDKILGLNEGGIIDHTIPRFYLEEEQENKN